jgi:1-acyl-sn-glycerol-3-phosphate acyltransferase
MTNSPQPTPEAETTMGDAEIIPIGTRGKPGRGTGSAKPSTSARSLVSRPTARAVAKKVAPREPADTVPVKEPGVPASPEAVTIPTPRTPTRTPTPTPTQSQSAIVNEPVDHRHPTSGIPAVDWLSGFTSAAVEVFGDNWEPRLAAFLAFLRRRLTGDYSVDEYGFDAEITQRFFMTAIRPVAEKWFRIEVRGVENIPSVGGALVVSNHSGTVPIDGMMTAISIHDHAHRFLRPLGADLVFKLPIVSEMARKGGVTLACNEDAERMLKGGEIVGVWPEGFKGIGKPYSERYKLQRFGRGGFVSAAIRTGVPIVPTSVVGAEEIYPLVGNIPSLARLLGVPYIPITPFFPLLGPLGLIPLPSKWIIEFGEPIRTDEYDPGAADDPMLVFNVTDQVRETIQQTLYGLLMQRKSVFG